MKKLIALLLTMLLVLPTMTFAVGCGTGGNKTDDSKSQLIIGLHKSGYGRDWMDAIIADFEEAYADTEFEPGTGKKGVQVTLRVKPDAYTSSTLLNSIKYADEDIIVGNNLQYYDFVTSEGTSDYIVDLGELIQEGGKEDSIYNRLSKESRNYLNVGTEENPKIYLLPFVSGTWGLYYDKDLFEEKGFYTLSGYKGLDCVDGNDDDLWGPDGVEGTVDDGMPATFEDFKFLVNTMITSEVTPFTWTGEYGAYRAEFLNTVLAAYEGEANFKARYTFEGTFNDQPIDRYNAYQLADQEGIKAMLAFARFMVSNSEFYSAKVKTMTSHTDAQKEFVLSGKKYNVKPIGFLLEGGWFEQEASNDIKTVKALGKTANYGVMPIPKFIGSEATEGVKDQTNTKTVFAGTPGTGSGGMIVNKKTNNLDLAKEFVKFFFQEEQNATFTTITNLIAPYDYELSTEQYNSISTLCKDRYDYTNSEYVDTVQFRIKNLYYTENASYFYKWNFNDVGEYSDIIAALLSGKTTDWYLSEYKKLFTASTWPIKAN